MFIKNVNSVKLKCVMINKPCTSYFNHFFKSTYHFLLHFYLDTSINTYWELDDVILAAQCSSPEDLVITTEKKIDFLERSVLFKVKYSQIL